MNAILSTLGTVAFYVIVSVIVYFVMRFFESLDAARMDEWRRTEMKSIAWEMIQQWEKDNSIAHIAQTAKAIDEAVPNVPCNEKPCYCLGRETIEKVADDGQMQTERVDFVAADTLFRMNPYAELTRLRGLFKTYADHTGECKYLEGHNSVCTCGLRTVLEGLHD